MNIFRTPAIRTFALALALPLIALFLAACEVGSVDSTSSIPSDNAGTIYNFAGLYMSPKFDPESTNALPALVYPNDDKNHPSGKAITSLRLLQYGSVLEAYDSAGLVWNGKISSLQGSTATFSLRGRTTDGLSVEIAGTLAYANQQSTMDATWIEPAFYGSLFAKATVSPAATNIPVSGVSISPKSATFTSNSLTRNFTASGGTGSYTWSVSDNTRGNVNSTTGSSVSYTSQPVSGNNTITVTDSNGKSDYATVTYSTSNPAIAISTNSTDSGSSSDDSGPGGGGAPPIP